MFAPIKNFLFPPFLYNCRRYDNNYFPFPVVTFSISESPQILGPAEQRFPSGDDFTLSCEGNSSLSWSYPESVCFLMNRMILGRAYCDGYFFVQEETEFSSSLEEENSTYFVSRLNVSHAHYLATGYYHCSDGNSSAQVYVYVVDYTNLLAVRDLDRPVVALQHQEFVVPCKPTDPDVNVTLLWGDSLVSNI